MPGRINIISTRNLIFALHLLFSTLIHPVGQPVSPLVAAPGSDITLGCFFPHSENDVLYNLIVVWRRGDTEMVHSYKQQEDKLEKQSAAYRGRTRLYPDQLAAGNASLRLTGVQASDHGEYTCAGANEQGPFQMEIVLLVAAPYEEPQLDIQTTCDSIVLTFRSTLGFPEPTVLWKIETGSDITNQSNTTLDLKDGVHYEVLSKMVLKPSDTQTVTFELMLGLLNQTFSRSITVHPLPECCGKQAESRSRLALLVSVSILLIGLAFGCSISVFMYKKRCMSRDAGKGDVPQSAPDAEEDECL